MLNIRNFLISLTLIVLGGVLGFSMMYVFLQNTGKEIVRETKYIAYEESFSDAIRTTSKSLVTFIAGGSLDYQTEDVFLLKPRILGVGTVISQNGMVITHKKVIHKKSLAVDIFGNVYDVTATYQDPFSDLVLVQLQSKDTTSFIPVEIETTPPHVGDRVSVVGNFWNGRSPYVTNSIIRDNGEFIFSSDAYSGIYILDKDISSPHLGAPVINTSGRVLGLIGFDRDDDNSAIISLEHVNNLIRSLDLYGELRGVDPHISYRLVDEVFAKKVNLPIFYGAYLLDDWADFDLKRTDIVLRIDSLVVSSKYPIEKILKNFLPNDVVRVQYFSSEKFLDAPKNDVSDISSFVEEFIYEKQITLK